jgi:AraC-like DNA-binding protein
VRSGVFHLLTSANPARMETLTLYFAQEAVHSPGSVDANLEYFLLFHGGKRAPRIALDEASRAKILHSMEIIATESRDRRDFYRIAVKNALCDILLVLNRLLQVQSRNYRIPSLALRDANRLRPVFDLIHQSYTERLKLSELAAAANIGQSSFCRFFKRVTGLTVMDYIRRFRIDRAKELLMTTDRAVTWIAYESGFESHSHFDRVFRAVTNLTPHEFRTRYAPKVSAASPPPA